VNLAWPTAEIAVMGAKGAVNIIHRGKGEEAIAKEIGNYERMFCTPVRLSDSVEKLLGGSWQRF
jgi:propionyl-CoA carboxylase beta chain